MKPTYLPSFLCVSFSLSLSLLVGFFPGRAAIFRIPCFERESSADLLETAQGLRYGEGVRISSEFRERNASAVANWFSRIENEICKLGLPSVLICIRLPDLKKKLTIHLRFADFQDSNF